MGLPVVIFKQANTCQMKSSSFRRHTWCIKYNVRYCTKFVPSGAKRSASSSSSPPDTPVPDSVREEGWARTSINWRKGMNKEGFFWNVHTCSSPPNSLPTMMCTFGHVRVHSLVTHLSKLCSWSRVLSQPKRYHIDSCLKRGNGSSLFVLWIANCLSRSIYRHSLRWKTKYRISVCRSDWTIQEMHLHWLVQFRTSCHAVFWQLGLILWLD